MPAKKALVGYNPLTFAPRYEESNTLFEVTETNFIPNMEFDPDFDVDSLDIPQMIDIGVKFNNNLKRYEVDYPKKTATKKAAAPPPPPKPSAKTLNHTKTPDKPAIQEPFYNKPVTETAKPKQKVNHNIESL